jgi:hypothetical protein
MKPGSSLERNLECREFLKEAKARYELTMMMKKNLC